MPTGRHILASIVLSIVAVFGGGSPAHAATAGPSPSEVDTSEVDPCWLLGPILGDRC